MREGEGSRTAVRVAMRRAAHQVLDHPLVFRDPLAALVLPPSLAADLESNPQRFDASTVGRFLRALLVARSRIAEDALAEAVGRGVRQYVVLGAGFDTFAYRNPHAGTGLRVFELDHPATQAVKRRRLADARLAPVGDVVFAGVDLSRSDLQTALDDAGFDSNAESFFSWLGVIPYLELDAIRTTLSRIASLPGGSTIVFDYGSRPPWYHLPARLVLWRMSAAVAKMGEPWKSFFKPHQILSELKRAGFQHSRSMDAPEINERYFSLSPNELRVGSLAHLALASTVTLPTLETSRGPAA